MIFIFSLSAFTAEVDQFTNRDKVLPDQAKIVNKLANDYIAESIRVTNTKISCNHKKSHKILYNQLKKYFANHFKGKFLKEIVKGDTVQVYFIPVKESIFNQWTLRDGMLMAIPWIAELLEVTSPLIQIGTQKIGTDKFEHMFGQGFSYFEKFYKSKKDLASVLKEGFLKEKRILGGGALTTGVLSFADLSANFNGMRFWNHMLGLNEDVMGQELGPYIICEDGKFVKNIKNSLDFRNYIDASMDEGINCSEYSSKNITTKIDQLFIDSEGQLSCPMEAVKLEEMKSKYHIELSDSKLFLDDLIFNPSN